MINFLWNDLLWNLIIYRVFWLLSLFKFPNAYKKQSYFPNKRFKGATRILLDQAINVIKFGRPCEYYFLYGFDGKRYKEMTDYIISYREFARYRDINNLSDPHNATCILRNKILFGMVANSLGINTPINIGVYFNENVFIFDQKKHIQLSEFIRSGNYDIFAKDIYGEGGNGVMHLIITSGQINIYKEGIHNITLEELKEKLNGSSYLFQKTIDNQQSIISSIYPKSLNTIRFTSIKDEKGKITFLQPILRIGCCGMNVDNFTQGGICVGFDVITGRLYKTGYYGHYKYGTTTNKHPDTDIDFSKIIIPFIDEIKQQVILFHSFLDVHSIGWDIALTEDGPKFIEGNENWEIELPQMYCGKRAEFDKYFVKQSIKKKHISFSKADYVDKW